MMPTRVIVGRAAPLEGPLLSVGLRGVVVVSWILALIGMSVPFITTCVAVIANGGCVLVNVAPVITTADAVASGEQMVTPQL